MSDLTETGKNETFTVYAEKHDLYDLFHSTVSKLLISRPTDPYQYLIDAFSKTQTSRSIILLAPPISNLKDTIESLARQLDVVHIHTGTLLEKAFQKQTSAGVQARAFVEKGQLVPDYLITSMILQQLKDPDVVERGYILDGFPRTKQQALALLQAGFLPDHVLDIEIPNEIVLQRALGLRYDPVTAETINIQDNITRSPVVESRLIVKPSDTMESVKERLAVYHRHNNSVAECFKNSYRKFSGVNPHGSNMISEIELFLGQKPVSKAPRSFRIILAGLPGSGKSIIAEKMAAKYGCVVVSPQKAMREAISAGRGDAYLPFLDQPNFAPSELIGEVIIERLKQRDCVDNGWVLEGFPIKTQDAIFLKNSGITPNRVIWLSALQSTCWSRLVYRRYDPESSQVVNLKKVPKQLVKKDLSKWIQAPKDFDTVLEMRFNEYETTERDLKKFYGVRSTSNPTGIFHSINSDGIGEEDESGVNPSVETVFELVQGHLARPIPASTSN